MWLAAFYIWGTLLTFSVGDIFPENAASWITLNPLGDCGDEEVLCPYRLTLPPLSIQLPRPFRELEEMAKELQNLKEVVNQLRRDCQECKGRHSIERGGWMDHKDDEERRPQHPRHNISIKDTQSLEEEKVTRIFTSTLPQGDTSETIKGSEKRPNHSILGGREWNINPRIDSTQGTTDLTSEMSREVKIFNPLLDEVPEDISERELKRSEVTEPSLAIKKNDVQTATNGKLQPNVLRDGHAKNISDILTMRRRVQNVDDPNGLRDPSTKTKDLSTSVGNRRVVNFPGGGRPLRPRGSFINSRVVSFNNGDRLKTPAFVRKTNPQVGETMDKTEPEEDGFSPVRSGIMRVKETSPRIANTKSGGISGPSLSTDDQNKQGISRVSGPKTDEEHARVSEDNSRNRNKTKITGLPTKLRKEKQGDVSHTDANKSGSSIMNSAEQPNMVKEEKEHMGLSESLVDVSSSAVNRQYLPVPGRQVEIEKYLNPITETNNGQIGSTILDEADSPFNAGTVNPPDLTDEMQLETFIVGAVEETGLNLLNTDTVDIQSNRKASFSEDLVKPTVVPTVKSKSETNNGQIASTILDKPDSSFNAGRVHPPSPDLTDEMQLETFIVGAVEETGLNLLNTDTEDIQSNRKASFSEDLVEPTIVPTVKSKSINTNVRMTSRFKSPVGGHGTRRTSKTPLKAVAEQPQNRKTNISIIHEVRQEARYVIPNITAISPAGPKLRTNVTGKQSVNRSIGVPLKLSTPFRKNVSGIIKPNYTRKKPNFQTELNTNRGIKTKVSTTNQFLGPTGAAPTVERETIKQIPQARRPNVLDNHRLKNNITELKNVGDVRDLDKVREGINRPGDISSSSQDSNTMQSGTSNLPTSENEGTSINGQNPSEGRKKRPIVSTLKREFSKEPGASQFTASEHENVDIVTNTNVEMSKNLSRDTHRTSENVGPTPNVKSNVLHNPRLKNNNTKSKTPSKPQNAANVQDLENVQTQDGDNSETNTEDPNIRQSESSNSPTGGKESRTLSVDEVDNRMKGPKAPTLKTELSKEPGMIQLATVSLRDTENNATVTNAHVETHKSGGGDTPISFENIGATKELEHIKLNKDRVVENPGEVLSNQNSVDTAQSYSGERYAVPVVSEGLPNVEEIKGSKLFSLSPEDTAEGFKSHAVSDEVTEREKAETKIHSTCLGDCNTTSTQHSQTSTSQTRTPLAFGREKGPAQDCADYMTKSRRNGVYRVTPRPKNTTFPVFCDMASSGGGWTMIQHRFDGSTSFNRTWDEYKNGFGKLLGEFWLGNDKIHLLTKAKNMSLRIEIEDFEGIREYAQYDHFYVANESQHYRLSIDGYSGTAGNALQFSKKYNHDQKFFTTPDRDNDQYPSGNCGAYYSSGWWFDACMSANLNGKYYQSKYKGVRNGIFWGTWHNITMEYYPTNERQSFRTVRMMIRPKK